MNSPLFRLKCWLLFLLLLAGGNAFSQTCSISNPDTIICQGATVSFSLSVSGGIPTTYAWNFGNGFTANTELPSHTYTTAGDFTPTVVVTFQGGLTCNAAAKSIKVRSTPIPKFTITTPKQLCFKDNELCVQDQSIPGASKAPIKQRVYQLSNGFLQIDTPPFTSQICYKNGTDILGHLYTLVLEVTDTNNCVGRLQKKDSAELFPKIEHLDFTVDTIYNCNVTHTKFTNTSLIPRSRVSKFKWLFGDGTADSTNWFTTTHAYTSADTCYPILVVTDVNNCIDSVKTGFYVTVFFPDSAIHALQNTTQCFKGNFFAFKSKSEGVDLIWGIFDVNGNQIYREIVDEDSVLKYRAITCGQFKVRLIISRGISCIITTDSVIHVVGPNAIIDNMTDQVVNGRQCSIKDTVYFKTPVPYLSCTYMNGAGIKHFWNFDDNFAPQCTLDTRKGINIGMNCNFSKDSMMVKHYYTPGKERCYQVSLYMVDTISGCDHTRYKPLPLMAPEASPDTSATPPRMGLRYLNNDTIHCLDESVIFDFKSLLPGCDYTVAYMYLDSACDTCSWVAIPGDSLGGGLFQTSYSYTTDSNGYVTVGLIIANGDLGGEMCYDTAWYHHFLNLFSLDPLFKASVGQSCGPTYTLSLVPLDTVQYHLKSAFWRIMSTSGSYYMDTFRQVFVSTDSIVMRQQREVLRPGIYDVILTLENINGCLSFELQKVSFGNFADFGTLKPVSCVYDSVDVFSDIAYIDGKYPDKRNPNHYWNQPDRAAAGKENVSWDMGDGNGFSLTGGSVRFNYPKPGTYSVRMAYQDSIGCKDTITKLNFIHIVGTKAFIDTLPDQYYCAPQIVLFNNTSFVYDSLPFGVPSVYDTIATYQWTFGDNTPESGLEDPAHNYTRNGVFDVRMVAISGAGCSDTDYAQVKITGPMPSFTINDTLGCVPFTVILNNTTGKPLKSWTWYYGDSANQTLTTLNDNSVTFTYTEPGIYSIRLLGSQDVTNPTTGNTVNCNSFFPDPATNIPVRKVYVKPPLPVTITSVDSICAGTGFLLIANADSTYTKFVWRISNGDSIHLNRPDSVSAYTFDSTGFFTIHLFPVENPTSQCWDSATATINVLSVLADFEIDSTKSPVYAFHNTSFGSTLYRWDFGKPSAGAANESNSVNGEFDFGHDTATYSVCLFVLNALDCWDSACKPVQIKQMRLIIPNVFTPGNGDGYNDAFDIDILGFTEYHLLIYNRWGTLVYESMQDGYQNDGINWNGNDHQTGPPCSDGTYYYVFTYKMYTESASKSAHGTITLIRNK